MAKSDAILERLLRLHPKKIDLSLDRVLHLLDRLGRPHEKLPPVVHVAGTNGKGSSIAFMRAMLEAAGYRAHVYTSPHLVRFNERIRLVGELISEAALSALLEDCETANRGDSITYFEITTAAAFKAFAETPADIVLLECGLGGRYDATSVVSRPALTAITPVSMDHMQFLGDTLAQIAGEKAAIQKPGVVSVIGAQTDIPLRVMEDEALARGAPVHRMGVEWTASREAEHLVFDGVRRFPLPGLLGPHQIANAGLAIACIDKLDEFKVGDEAIAHGLRHVDWPARLQRLTSGPLIDALPGGWELWLDGGHNAAAGETLAAVAADWAEAPLHLVFGMLDSKEPAAFLRPLVGRIEALHAIAIPGEDASLSADAAATAAKNLGIVAAPAEDVGAAIATISANATAHGRILICGSLYLVGQVLADNA
ncbi:MAG: folylpolyglutamate synthase/dihydrofolate synthase family protein [Pseudomonadota bacterium]|nr:folylpolyglutamate synthase/dihydrofolate synthase family protein [Pseudomonadota bacterium]